MKVKCIKDVYMDGNGALAFRKDKIYEAEWDENGKLVASDENGNKNHIIKDNYDSWFNEYFVDESEDQERRKLEEGLNWYKEQWMNVSKVNSNLMDYIEYLQNDLKNRL